jgi:HTH-type transcriptional regulator/antitoxin HigA
MPAAKLVDKNRTRAASDRYLELVRACPLLPITNEAEALRAAAMIDRLTDQRSLDGDEEDYRDLLAGLLYNYEIEHEHEPRSTPSAMLRHLLEAKGVTQGVAAAETGLSEATISQILTGKRVPSRRAIAALADYFKVEPGVFF